MTEAIQRSVPGLSSATQHPHWSRKADSAAVSWELVREIGPVYHADPLSSSIVSLCCPVLAERERAGHRLIVDDVEGKGSVPVRFQCRSMLLNKENQLLFDSQRMGIHDGYARFAEDGQLAILRRTQWEILIVTYDGELRKRIDLSTISKWTPRLLTWTGHSFLVLFLTKSHQLDLAEVDECGRLVRWIAGISQQLGVPSSMQALPGGRVLVADEFNHVVREIGSDGEVRTRWGEFKHPSRSLRHLSCPKWAQELSDGRLVVADSNNHRLIAIEDDHRVSVILDTEEHVAPACIQETPQGELLICDMGNRSVTEYSWSGQQLWQAGERPVEKLRFSFPRSVEFSKEDGRVLVADTCSDRIVIADSTGDILRPVPLQESADLFWPRCASRSREGIVIADGRRSRIVEVAWDGKILRSLDVLRKSGSLIELSDPHDVRQLKNGNLLITNTGGNCIVEANWQGDVLWSVGMNDGLNLSDPHSAQLTDDGWVIISDPGNHRIVAWNRENSRWYSLESLTGPDCIYRFQSPRYAELDPELGLMIVDTGNNRILAGTSDGQFLWQCDRIPGSPITTLLHPRWAQWISKREFIVNDHFHHRIVHLQRA